MYKKLLQLDIVISHYSKYINFLKLKHTNKNIKTKYQGSIFESFRCKAGLIQGEALWPFVFSLFVTDLEMELLSTTNRSYELNVHCLFM